MKTSVCLAGALCALVAVSCVYAEESRKLLASYPGQGIKGCGPAPYKMKVKGGYLTCKDWEDDELECKWKGTDNKGQVKEYKMECKYDDDGRYGEAECVFDPQGASNSFKFKCPQGSKNGPIECDLDWRSFPLAAGYVTEVLATWCPNDD